MADTKQELIDALSDAFANELASFMKPITYKQTKMGTYDATSGASTDSVKKVSLKAFVGAPTEKQLTLGMCKVGELLCKLEQSKLPFSPEVNDVVTYGKDDYDVVSVQGSGINFTWKLTLRLK